jgi:hypothetical protein
MRMRIVLTVGLLSHAAFAGWSATRNVKRIEFDSQISFSKLTIVADDGAGSPEESFIYKFACAAGVSGCYNNTVESAKFVDAILMESLATGSKVKFNWDYTEPAPDGTPDFRTIQIER